MGMAVNIYDRRGNFFDMRLIVYVIIDGFRKET